MFNHNQHTSGQYRFFCVEEFNFVFYSEDLYFPVRFIRNFGIIRNFSIDIEVLIFVLGILD
jgi:hypothetical protein